MSLFRISARIPAKLLARFIIFFFAVFFFSPAIFAGSYELNPTQSQINFQFYHLSGKEKISGSFAQFEVDIALDNSQEIEFLNIKIDTTSIISKNGNTNLLLKEKFFDAQKYGQIILKSKNIENLSQVAWVTGDLNIKDNVHKVILKLYKKKIATTRSFEDAYIFSGKLLLNPEDFELNKKTMRATGQKKIKTITSENLLELFFKIEVFRPF